MGLYSQLRYLASTFPALSFSSDCNNLGWALIIRLLIDLLVLLGWLGWAVSTPAAPKKVAHGKPPKWVRGTAILRAPLRTRILYSE